MKSLQYLVYITIMDNQIYLTSIIEFVSPCNMKIVSIDWSNKTHLKIC